MSWVFGTLAVLLGVFGLIVGLRGRVVARGAFCAKCRFDLGGTKLDAADARCPECGSALRSAFSSVRLVNPVLRRKRPMMILGASGALLVGLGLLGSETAARLQGVDWRLYAPTSWLLRELAQNTNPAGEANAARVLAMRADKNKLKPEELSRLAEQIVRRYADDTTTWTPAWSDLAARFIRDNVFTPEQTRSVWRHAVDVHMRPRSSIRQGDGVPVEKASVFRPIPGHDVGYMVYVVELDADGRITVAGGGIGSTLIDTTGQRETPTPRGIPLGGWSAGTKFRIDAPNTLRHTPDWQVRLVADPGEQELAVSYLVTVQIPDPNTPSGQRVRVYARDFVGKNAAEIEAAFPALAARIETMRFTAQIYPAGTEDDLVRWGDAESDAAMLATIRLGPISRETRDYSGLDGPLVNARIGLIGTPGPPTRLTILSGYFIAERDGKRWYLGSGTLVPGTMWMQSGTVSTRSVQSQRTFNPQTGHYEYRMVILERVPPEMTLEGPFEPLETLFELDRVDVRVIPSIAHARSSVDRFALWNRVAIFRDVVVTKDADPAFTGRVRRGLSAAIGEIRDVETGAVIWTRGAEPEPPEYPF